MREPSRGVPKHISDRWWWRDPVRPLRDCFPGRSDSAIRKYVWPEFERAAFNYELASRRNRGGKPKYLLGKCFAELSSEQMGDVAKVWPRVRPVREIELFPYWFESQEVRLLKAIAEGSSCPCPPPSASRKEQAAHSSALVQRAVKRDTQTLQLECHYVRASGWTVPRNISINLAGCGDTTIVNAFKKWVKAERERFSVAPPARNKGRRNRSPKGISFHSIEALDVWNNLSRSQAESMRSDLTSASYDEAQKRSAARKAHVLRRDWVAAKTVERAERKRIEQFLARPTPPQQDMDTPHPFVAAFLAARGGRGK